MAQHDGDVATNLDVDPGFSGVVSVRTGTHVEYERAFGYADRAHEIAMTVQTQLATASGTKAFTAVAVLSLVADGLLSLGLAARSLLGADLPLIDGAVTVEHLLTHRSGIGDYVDEDLPEEQALKVPVSALETTEAYLPALDGYKPKFAPGRRFSYCNSGYVVLALLAERAAGTPFGELVRERVFVPAGMDDSAFLRSDRLPGRAALGYLDDGRTNVFALPVLGSGDGGAYTTVADIRAFWHALRSGTTLPRELARRMVTPTTTDTGHSLAYGMGVWLRSNGAAAVLEGADHGVSIRSLHDPRSDRVATVVSNTSDGAWPIARQLLERF